MIFMKHANFLKKINAWLRLVRIEHALLSAIGVLVGLMIATKQGAAASLGTWAYALLVPIFINIGAFSLNDYFDIEADKQNKRKRPLVQGELGKNVAIYTAIAGLVIGSIIGFLINFEAGIIALAFAILSALYNWKLKDIAIAGNLFIAISMAIAFVFGAVAAGQALAQASGAIWILAIGATFAGMAREIVKTVQDMEGDAKARGSKSLPHIIGEKNSLYLASVCFLAFVISLPFFVAETGMKIRYPGMAIPSLGWNIFSLGLLAICAFAFIAMAYMGAFGKGEGRLERIRRGSLIALAIALGAILLAGILG